VSRLSPSDSPTRLLLLADWRILGFGTLLAVAVTLLFGLAPALRVTATTRKTSRRLMHALVAAQVAFCFVVHFVSGLFVASFDRLSNQPTGFHS